MNEVRVSEAVRERAEKLVHAAHLPIESIRYEALYGLGLRVRACQTICGVVLVYKTPEGVWDLAENKPPETTMTERDKRWS